MSKKSKDSISTSPSSPVIFSKRKSFKKEEEPFEVFESSNIPEETNYDELVSSLTSTERKVILVSLFKHLTNKKTAKWYKTPMISSSSGSLREKSEVTSSTHQIPNGFVSSLIENIYTSIEKESGFTSKFFSFDLLFFSHEIFDEFKFLILKNKSSKFMNFILRRGYIGKFMYNRILKNPKTSEKIDWFGYLVQHGKPNFIKRVLTEFKNNMKLNELFVNNIVLPIRHFRNLESSGISKLFYDQPEYSKIEMFLEFILTLKIGVIKDSENTENLTINLTSLIPVESKQKKFLQVLKKFRKSENVSKQQSQQLSKYVITASKHQHLFLLDCLIILGGSLFPFPEQPGINKLIMSPPRITRNRKFSKPLGKSQILRNIEHTNLSKSLDMNSDSLSSLSSSSSFEELEEDVYDENDDISKKKNAFDEKISQSITAFTHENSLLCFAAKFGYFELCFHLLRNYEDLLVNEMDLTQVFHNLLLNITKFENPIPLDQKSSISKIQNSKASKKNLEFLKLFLVKKEYLIDLNLPFQKSPIEGFKYLVPLNYLILISDIESFRELIKWENCEFTNLSIDERKIKIEIEDKHVTINRNMNMNNDNLLLLKTPKLFKHPLLLALENNCKNTNIPKILVSGDSNPNPRKLESIEFLKLLIDKKSRCEEVINKVIWNFKKPTGKEENEENEVYVPSLLMYSLKNKNLRGFRLLLSKFPELINKTDRFKRRNILHQLCFLRDQGENNSGDDDYSEKNSKNLSNHSTLKNIDISLSSCQEKKIDKEFFGIGLKCILKYGKDLINSKDENGNTPLHLAVQQGNLQMISHLLRFKANFTIRNEHQQIPFEMTDCVNIRNFYIYEQQRLQWEILQAIEGKLSDGKGKDIVSRAKEKKHFEFSLLKKEVELLQEKNLSLEVENKNLLSRISSGGKKKKSSSERKEKKIIRDGYIWKCESIDELLREKKSITSVNFKAKNQLFFAKLKPGEILSSSGTTSSFGDSENPKKQQIVNFYLYLKDGDYELFNYGVELEVILGNCGASEIWEQKRISTTYKKFQGHGFRFQLEMEMFDNKDLDLDVEEKSIYSSFKGFGENNFEVFSKKLNFQNFEKKKEEEDSWGGFIITITIKILKLDKFLK